MYRYIFYLCVYMTLCVYHIYNYKKETLICYGQITLTYDQGSLNNKLL